MASRNVLQDTATVFIPIEEDDFGVMRYNVYLLTHIFCRVASGTKKNKTGTLPDEQIDLFIFDSGSMISKDGVDLDLASTCENIFKVTRASDFSDECVELGYVVPCDASTLVKPPSLSRRIRSVIRRKAGTRRMWHWEVHAK